jgi:hypothetical protein
MTIGEKGCNIDDLAFGFTRRTRRTARGGAENCISLAEARRTAFLSRRRGERGRGTPGESRHPMNHPCEPAWDVWECGASVYPPHPKSLSSCSSPKSPRLRERQKAVVLLRGLRDQFSASPRETPAQVPASPRETTGQVAASVRVSHRASSESMGTAPHSHAERADPSTSLGMTTKCRSLDFARDDYEVQIPRRRSG